ncbi:hypothetical protein D3C71_77100 [compost metagenome]
MLNQITKFLFPTRHMAAFPVSSNLLSVLPDGFERYVGRLPLLSRAKAPLFNERQVCELVRVTQQTGDGYMLDHLVEHLILRLENIDHVVGVKDSKKKTHVQPRSRAAHESVLQENLKLSYFCSDAVALYRNPELYYELLDSAHAWMEWKVRAALWPTHVSNEVVVRAHWNFVNYLLMLEFPYFARD